MSLVARFKTDVTNAWHDAYGSVIFGDDAGKAAKLVVLLKPTRQKSLNLGMTLLEINGRAYVKSVAPDSEPAKAGVLPRDAVQFASVYRPEWLHEHQDDADDAARAYGLDCEAKGMRVNYEELRRILAEGMDPLQSAFISPNPSASSRWHAPQIPSTIHVCASDASDYQRPLSPFQKETPRAVLMVLRRTRQRPSTGMLAHFRLDDECDFAASLVRRLAPTSDMDMPVPDAWEELVHDGTDWLLGGGSILPPRGADAASRFLNESADDKAFTAGTGGGSIPLDAYEQQRAVKLARLRSRMAAENMHVDRADDVEAATIRGMIQKAVGLAFVRASKVVLGVSIHAGSGIVISRLADGTWSAPSSIGTWGLGLGLQFGLEVAEYIFILQTPESLAHFCRGGSFTIGGNVGAAVAGMGREAYGAASVGNACSVPTSRRQRLEDEYNDEDSFEGTVGSHRRHSSVAIAPIVAYAKSQGLYVGVSLEGSRIFTRDEINARSYKFSTGREVTANDILSGKVATPPEAEDLYQALHSVEFTHEMSCLPRPPECLRKDSPNAWYYDKSTLGGGGKERSRMLRDDPFDFLQNLSEDEEEEIASFETQFKKFMYGGVSVQRLIPNSESRSGKTRKERRTLWLMLPEIGALKLGFVSKLSDGDGTISNKSSTQRAKAIDVTGDDGNNTVASEEVTLDSALVDQKDSPARLRKSNSNVQLSNKHSVALTDVTMLSQDPHVKLHFQPNDQTEHLRIISIQDVSGTSLLFLANNFREAELLYCGLKLLLERETSRLGVRGGLPITALGGRATEGAMSPAAARGFKETPMPDPLRLNRERRRSSSNGRNVSGYSSSEMDNETDQDDGSTMFTEDSSGLIGRGLPEGRKTWGKVPGRAYMRNQAAAGRSTLVPPMVDGDIESYQDQPSLVPQGANGVPRYVLGQLLVRDISTNVQLPLPLPLCRVLLLDSSSPVISKWEADRGDVDFSKTDWTFPPATPREGERHESEHHLIASGSMMGAHRTSTFSRPRNGSTVRLSETQIVDADDSEKLAFTISERMPRRGFSIKVKVILRAHTERSCDASVIGEVRPVGKNMSNQAAVHKAFLLVMNEIKLRYGTEGSGLMAGFLTVVSDMSTTNGLMPKSDNNLMTPSRGSENRKQASPFPRTSPQKKRSGLVSLQDVMKENQAMQQFPTRDRPATPSFPTQEDTPKRPKKVQAEKKVVSSSDDFPLDENEPHPMTIEVKPLPKIRLSLMPAPREEDEEDDSSASRNKRAQVKKKKKSSRNRKSSRRTPAIGGSRTTPPSASSSRRLTTSSRRIPDAS